MGGGEGVGGRGGKTIEGGGEGETGGGGEKTIELIGPRKSPINFVSQIILVNGLVTWIKCK